MKNKNIIGTGVGTLGGLSLSTTLLPDDKAELVWETVGGFCSKVTGILEDGGDFIQKTIPDLVEKVPNIGGTISEFSPFIAPVLICGRAAYKLSDLMKIENKVLKGVAIGFGAGVGIAVTNTAIAPLLVGAGTLYAGLKYGGKFVKKLGGKKPGGKK